MGNPIAMTQIRLIFTLHNHQPVGNFGGVFEDAYAKSYRPFLDVVEDYPDIPFVLHTSGPLLEWLAENKPEYIARVRRLVSAGRVEILGGPFFEPILTMIPHRDRVGQILAYSQYLEDLLGARPRGAWIPERVWEQHLVTSLTEAGIEYTILDDYHFERAGLVPDELMGYYLSEDEGNLLKIFPGSERLRYLIPFQDPHESYLELRKIAAEHPGATVVCADDGEKFGSWPDTYDHVYNQGWLRRFCDMIRGNMDWLKPTTFAEAVDHTLPLGKTFLPDGSYREMTEWALPPGQLAGLKSVLKSMEGTPELARVLQFLRGGGFWRNFKAKYPESDAMYSRMLGISKRLARLESKPGVDPDYLEIARDQLFRGQCNCPYWHGSFGGLYLPHLRNAIYHHLIAADCALDDAEGKAGPRVSLDVADFNFDARQEVRLENDHLVAFIQPAMGGHLYELDIRHGCVNLLNTLERRPEPYHAAVAAANGQISDAPIFTPDRVVLKTSGLGGRIVYDKHPRKAFVDHFLAPGTSLDDLAQCRDFERGDFATGAYLSLVHRSHGRAALIMERVGQALGVEIFIRKEIELTAGSPELEVVYTIERLPEGTSLDFAVEINLAAMAGHADDRYYSNSDGQRLGMLDSRLELAQESGLSLTDEWLDLSATLTWSKPADVWAFPIETVSQSEGGFEGVYQSSAVVPRWRVEPDGSGVWSVRIRFGVRPFRLDDARVIPDLVSATALR